MLTEMQCPHSEGNVHLDTRDAGAVEKLPSWPGQTCLHQTHTAKKAFEESERRHRYNQQA